MTRLGDANYRNVPGRGDSPSRVPGDPQDAPDGPEDDGPEDGDDYFEIDFTTCPYYRRNLGVPGYENGSCSFGCRDEPECVTGDWSTVAERKALRERLTAEAGPPDVCAITWGNCPLVPGYSHVCAEDEHDGPHLCTCGASL